MWRDPDQRPFEPAPEQQEAFIVWEALDNSLFGPVSRALAVSAPGESVNVNSLGEVPNSSWFQNRIGLGDFSPAEAARGPCRSSPPDPQRPLTVFKAKPDGANPGFMVRAEDGREYLLKLGGVAQGPRPIAAATVGSRIYHAAGYLTPCNRVAYVRPEQLVIEEGTIYESARESRPLTVADLRDAFDQGLVLRDGRVAVVMSRFVEGQPLGPWSFAGTRRDDPNDVVAHERRRELRGMRVLAAWIGHYDTRDGNTLSTWINVGPQGEGYVRHYVIDFGESFGGLWSPPAMGRAMGYRALFDVPNVAENWFSLGLVERPFRRTRFGPSGRIFAYYDVATFEPRQFATSTPNVAFTAATERDAAWMARIIAHFTPAHLKQLIATADFRDPSLDQELYRLLRGRQMRILREYLVGTTPLAHPRIEPRGATPLVCLEDLAVSAGLVGEHQRKYAATVRGLNTGKFEREVFSRNGGRQVCVEAARDEGYSITEVVAGTSDQRAIAVTEVHAYAREAAYPTVVGLRRSW